MPVFARIGPTKCTEWQMSWGLVFPPGLEPDRWCMPVCVLRAPFYVYYLYFSKRKEKEQPQKKKEQPQEEKNRKRTEKKKDRGP